MSTIAWDRRERTSLERPVSFRVVVSDDCHRVLYPVEACGSS